MRFNIKVGDIIKIKTRENLINSGCCDYDVIKQATKYFTIKDIDKSNLELYLYIVDGISTPFVDADIETVNYKEPELIGE